MQNKFEVKARRPDKFVCHVGWDSLKQSFFVYVARPMTQVQGKVVGDCDGHTILWKGTNPKEIKTVEDVARILEPYATLPREMYQTLRETRARNASSVAANNQG